MTTSALIGRITTMGNYEARYLHSDGYPSHALLRLHEVWRRHDGDLPLMLNRLLAREWSLLDPAGRHRDEQRGGGTSWVWVDGIGRSYPPDEMHRHPIRGHLHSERQEDHDWAYLWQQHSGNLCVYGRWGRRWQLATMISGWEWSRLTPQAARAVQDDFPKVVCP